MIQTSAANFSLNNSKKVRLDLSGGWWGLCIYGRREVVLLGGSLRSDPAAPPCSSLLRQRTFLTPLSAAGLWSLFFAKMTLLLQSLTSVLRRDDGAAAEAAEGQPLVSRGWFLILSLPVQRVRL